MSFPPRAGIQSRLKCGMTSEDGGQLSRPQKIAIDGPAWVGKSTIGALVAQRLGYFFLDTGAMYRALTWLALRKGIDPEDEAALARLAREMKLEIISGENQGWPYRVKVGSKNVSQEIRSPAVNQAVSIVSRHRAVRQELVARQRKLAGDRPIVMAGRDIGTVVLPDADCKIFLVASQEERVRRRLKELEKKDLPPDRERVLQEIRLRDKIDSERAVSPLTPAEDAHIVDTNERSVAEVLDEVLKIIRTDS